ncbi:energy-coupling factor ABC transporter permease [Candidatus Margulisiibacteriota bacterium]
MHIPDGFVNPGISYGLMGAAVAVLGYCGAKVKEAVTILAEQPAFAGAGRGASSLAGKGRRVLSKLGEQKIYQMGMVAALVFAAQMFNFPVASGTSGHLIGGVLAVVLLGPFAGTIAVAAVVIIQALFFADGGLIVMGANVINMACIAGLLSYYAYARLKKYLPEFLSIGAIAWASVMLAATATSLQLGLSGTYAFGLVLPAMLKVHAIIGVAEALITIVLVKTFRKLVQQ